MTRLDPQSLEVATEMVKAAAEGLLAPFHEAMRRALGRFADQIGELGGLYGQMWRLEREAAFWEKFQRIIQVLGREPSPIPPKTFFPLLHQAFLEDDDDLQQRWAALLATATTEPDAYRPMFADILRTLTAVEVGVLDRLYRDFLTYYRDQYDQAMPVHAAIEHVRVGYDESVAEHLISLGHLEVRDCDLLFTMNNDVDPDVRMADRAKLNFVLDSLMRNQLIRRGTDGVRSPALFLTTLGLRFLQACGTSSGQLQQ